MKTLCSILQNKPVCDEKNYIEDGATDENMDGYQGELLYNSLHGCGKYKWLLNNGLTIIYDGHFFVNELEGYGRVTYSSGGHFEGLFKRNRRFGPGVFTYPYGFQDVGLWDGNYLMRLSSPVNSKTIPRLAFSPNAKYQLLMFRTLVTIRPDAADAAKEILTMLGFTEDTTRTTMADELYNTMVRSRGSTFLDMNLFNKLFFRCRSKVEVHEDEEEVTSTVSKCLSNDFCFNHDKQVQLEELNKYVETMTKLIEYLNSKKVEILQGLFGEGEAMEEEEEESEHQDLLLLYKDDLGQFLEAVPWLVRATATLKGVSRRISRIVHLEDYDKYFEKLKEQFLQKLEELVQIATYNKEMFVAEREKLLETMEFGREEELEEKEQLKQKTTNNSEDVLAWNNQETIIDMMTHSFLNQDMEDQVSCDVSSIVYGNRHKYKQRGPYEEECVFFLECCSLGSVEKIKKLSSKYINPDLSDCKGNTGIFAAVSVDNTDVIKALGDLGASMNICNDECLTPLTLSLSKYLSIRHKVTNWELAFLPSNKKQLELKFQWYPSNSMDKIGEDSDPDEPYVFVHKSKSAVSENVNQFLDKKQKYLFDTECIKPPAPKRKQKGKKKKKGETKSKSTRKTSESPGSKKKDKEKKKEEALKEKLEKELKEIQTKLDTVYSTIYTLFEIGADPNFGEVPLAPLILALFSKSVPLVITLLSHNADPNIRCRLKNMTPLHHLVSKSLSEEDPRILRALLQYGAQPNTRTDSTHWTHEAELILQNEKLKDVNDEGKTVLHILSMRYDYVQGDNETIIIEMMKVLVHFGANTELEYLGHTPLTLAMLRGNVQLVNEMLETRSFDPNQILGRDWGVPLTVLLSPSYLEVQPPNVSKCIMETLIQHNANPLNVINDFGNAIEFVIHQNKPPPKNKKEKRGESTKSSKKSKKSRAVQLALTKFLREKTRNTLTRHIQAKCVKYLFVFISEGCLEDEFLTYLARFVSVEEGFKIIQLLIENKQIKITETCRQTCLMVLRFIEEANEAPSSSRMSMDQSQMTSMAETLTENLMMIIKPYVTNKYLAYPPELDKYNKQKYMVCFNCFCSVGKDLVVCPKCCVVYFCSEACNKQNNALKSKHKCKSLFYKSQKEDMDKYRRLGIPYECPLEQKLKWIAELIRERRLGEELRERALKEWEMIYGKIKEGSDNEREKFVQEKILVYKEMNVKTTNEKHRPKQKDRVKTIELPAEEIPRYNSPVDNNSADGDGKKVIGDVPTETFWSFANRGNIKDKWNPNPNVKTKDSIVSKNQESVEVQIVPNGSKDYGSGGRDDKRDPKEKTKWSHKDHGRNSKKEDSWGSRESVLDSKRKRSKSKDTRTDQEQHHSNTKTLLDSSSKGDKKQSGSGNDKESSKKESGPPGMFKSRVVNGKGQLESLSPTSRRSTRQSPHRVPKLGKLNRQPDNHQGSLHPSELPRKFQDLLEKLTENMSDLDVKRLLLPYSCFSGDQLYFRFRGSSMPNRGTYSDV